MSDRLPTNRREDGLANRARKVLRYTRLYGPSRTLSKVSARRHMTRRYGALPPSSAQTVGEQTVAMIGCGNYGYSAIGYYLRKDFGRVVAGAMDTDPHRAASLASYVGAPCHTTDVDELLALPGLRMAYIASNHASHTPYAVQAMELGLDVYVEKPHCTSEDQLNELMEVSRRTDRRVFLGFNRPGSKLGRMACDALAADSGPAMLNWFVATHHIAEDHWYLNPGEGGRVLGNLCHWTDFVLRAMGPERRPVEVVPSRAEQADVNCTITLRFDDDSLASITFSEKADPFEGVREKFCGHRGETFVWLDDFQKLTIERGPSRKTFRPMFRDHGHRRNIVGAYRSVHRAEPYDQESEFRHIEQTGRLFLAVKEALEQSRSVDLSAAVGDLKVAA